MKKVLAMSLVLCACKKSDIDFKYRLENSSGIFIENYEPVTIDQLNAFLIKVNDSLKTDSINVFISGENMEEINPKFDKKNFIKWFYTEAGDTTNLPKDMSFGFGTFKNNKFIKNDQWDEKLLNNKFLKE